MTGMIAPEPDDAERFVQELYEHLLHRDPDTAEKDHWVAVVRGGMPDRAIFRAFVDSQEYQEKNRVKPAYAAGHYYSPVVDPDSVADYVSNVSRGRFAFDTIPIRPEEMRRFWYDNLSLIQSTPFTDEPQPGFRFYYDNNIYPYGDAIMLRVMVQAHRPRRIVEIGSGFSTACMLDAIEEASIGPVRLTCIEPYPQRLQELLRPNDRELVEIVEQPVQQVALDIFEQLQSGDILFIDSTHVLKTGSDVHFELFHVLPRLRPGVLVHFHDIQYPFEYPDAWIFEQNFSWNEIYAVRAFLSYNDQFSIVFFNGWAGHFMRGVIQATCPDFLKNPGGSLWLRRNPAVR